MYTPQLHLFSLYETKIQALDRFRNEPTRLQTIYYHIYFLYALFECLRLLAVSIALKFHLHAYFYLDRFMYEFVLVTNFDYMAFLIISIWSTNALACHYIIYKSPGDGQIWKMIHTLVVTNSRHFFKLNPKLKNKKLLKAKNAKFNCKILQSFSGVTIQLRIRLVFMVILFNRTLAGIFCFGVLLYLCCVAYLFIVLTSKCYPVYQILLMQLNLTTMAYLYWSAFSNSQSINNSISILIFIYQHYLKQLCKLLANMLVQFTNKHSLYYRVYVAYKFEHFTKQHIEMIQKVEQMNRLVSKAFSTAILTNICFTCYMLTLILLKHLHPITEVVLMGIIVLAIVGAILAGLPLINLTRQIHAYGKYLVPIQAVMHPKLVIHKLKINQYYELINSWTKITFKVAPMGGVTMYSLLKLLILYSTYIMTSIEFYLNTLIFEM